MAPWNGPNQDVLFVELYRIDPRTSSQVAVIVLRTAGTQFAIQAYYVMHNTTTHTINKKMPEISAIENL